MEFAHLITAASAGALSTEQAERAMEMMADGSAAPEQIEALLTTPALGVETVSAGTLAGLARVVRRRAVRPRAITCSPLVDTCGTGGGACTFNVSTAAALVIAAARGRHPSLARIGVAKHGNRAITSKCGSADVLEVLGVAIDLEPDAAAASVEKHGFAFFFAQKYHRAFAHVQPVRKKLAERGVRTAFNLVGPLANPAGVTHQIVGVMSRSRVRVVAEALALLGVEAALVVCGESETGAAMDEVSASGPTAAVMLAKGELKEMTIQPEDFGVARAASAGLAVASREESAARVRAVLSGGSGDTAGEAAVIVNAAAGFHLAGTGSLRECAVLAREVVSSGAAGRLLDALVGVQKA